MIYELEFKGFKFKFDDGKYNKQGQIDDFTKGEVYIKNRFWNINKNDVIFDIGAMSGLYTLPSLAIGAKVYAFEPKMVHFYDLCTNIFVNRFTNCIPLNIGLFNKEGTIQFSNLMRSVIVQSEHENNSIEDIYVSTIDNIVRDYNVERLDWLKIDVEGAELQVIEGGIEALKEYKPNILVENHTCFIPNIDIKVKNFLNKFGYDVGETVPMQYGSHSFYKGNL